MDRFFIFDCNGKIIGNPQGYRTIRGANQVAKSRKVQNLVWTTFDNREDKGVTLVWEIQEQTLAK